MNRRHIFLTLLLVLAVVARAGEVVWFDGTRPVGYRVNGKTDAVVQIALGMFASDMEQVTGMLPTARNDAPIGVWQLDCQSPSVLKKLQADGVPVDQVRADGFFLGEVGGRIVVCGGNGRGTAYGLLELSRMAGVSPWVWWGDVTPQQRSSLVMADGTRLLQNPSVEFRGVFINDEDWSFREWSSKTFEPTGTEGSIGPRTYRKLFELLLRLRANTIWPAMHPGTQPFFADDANRRVADSCAIYIGTSHCEPLLRNNVGEWDEQVRGPYNYLTNSQAIQAYWAERLKQVGTSPAIFTLGMRGIHDGAMEGAATPDEQTQTLSRVLTDQRALLTAHFKRDAATIPQIFIPYKEVLGIMDNGLTVPDDVTLVWCDDNYGYLTRLSDAAQQARRGGAGVYYHLSYWGRPHDYLWLTTTQPGLLYHEMSTAYEHGARRLWIVNVHDPKVAAYQLELFLDMAWQIDCVTPATLDRHLHDWLATQFGPDVADGVAPALREFFRLTAIRKPEFMGWTQVELDKEQYPGGLSPVSSVEFTLPEACRYLADYGAVEAAVDAYEQLVPERLRDAYFAHVLYPVHAAADMARKMLSDEDHSQAALMDIQLLTRLYNTNANGKWSRLMDPAPRRLPVFMNAHPTLAEATAIDAPRLARNASHYQRLDGQAHAVPMLGHSMSALSLDKGATVSYDFTVDRAGEAIVLVALIPTQPVDTGDLRFAVQVDGQPATEFSLKEPFRSEQWKQNVLRGQARRTLKTNLTPGVHTLSVKALDEGIVLDQWAVDFAPMRAGYLIPAAD